jgi:hypothetical protein
MAHGNDEKTRSSPGYLKFAHAWYTAIFYWKNYDIINGSITGNISIRRCLDKEMGCTSVCKEIIILSGYTRVSQMKTVKLR